MRGACGPLRDESVADDLTVTLGKTRLHNRSGKTPLDNANQRGNKLSAAVLLKAGAKRHDEL